MSATPELVRLRKRLAEQYPLVDLSLPIAGREWRLTAVQDQNALVDRVQTDSDLDYFPYGLMLWASAVGVAERLAEQPELVMGGRVLEVGAGVGLPGIVAQSLGGRVTQTDYQTAALSLARLNADQNGITGIRHLLADWRVFSHDERYDLVLGSDVLYERTLHFALRRVFDRIVSPGGLLLLADPLRPQAAEFVDSLERSGWRITIEGRSVAWPEDPREIVLFFIERGETE